MLTYQFIRARYLWIVLTTTCLLYQSTHAQVQKKSSVDEVKATVRKVISALDALEEKLPATGRGTASLKMENYLNWLDDRELSVDFVFKGRNSRWDIFERIGDRNGPKLQTRVESEKCHILESYGMVDIQRAGVHDSSRDDIHPAVFTSFNDYPLIRRLQRILEYDFAANPEHYASTELDDKGILHIISGGPVESSEVLSTYEYQMSFDTKRELIPVLFKSTNKEPEGNVTSTVSLEWARYDSIWYVRRVEYNIEPGNENHRVLTIKNFSPNIDVSDKEFTLDGLNLNNRMIVHNGIKNTTYRYQEEKTQEQQFDEGIDADSSSTAVLYLRSYKTGRLIGPVSLKGGSLLPTLENETYIIADPTEYELSVRKALLDTAGRPANFLDCELDMVIDLFNQTLKSRLGDKAPLVQIQLGEKSTMPIMSIEFIEESIYETLCNIAAIAQLRIFIEQDTIVLSNKELREITGNK